MKELDAVGDALKGLGVGGGGAVGVPRARGNRCCNELAKLIQIFGVLALADSLLSLPVTVWEPGLSEAMAGQLVDNLEQMKEPPCL